MEPDLQTCCVTSPGGLLTLGEMPASCLKCWLILAVFLAMLWELRRWILSLMLSCSLFLYLSAESGRGGGLSAEVRGQRSGEAGGRERARTDFSEALVLVDAAVEGDGGVSGPLQQAVGRVGGVRVLLDGLQEQRVARHPLHRHHQEEAQRRGVDLGPGGRSTASGLHPRQAEAEQTVRTRRP